MPNGMTPNQQRAYHIAAAALENLNDQLAKKERLPLLKSQQPYVFTILMNVALQSMNPETPPESTPSPV